ncbi:hypothetical protein OsI_37923 [Oryza sativa Indica Group]|uniref:Uncharacterized protein n=1 Tax=Oryza sativa subsp. indica TaxID=39946 RepID=B8BNR0_ORYSI|nr:hypothetical protein OsI_37923 [Oryza sativa Indica Group]
MPKRCLQEEKRQKTAVTVRRGSKKPRLAFARQPPLRDETARQRPQEGELTIVVGPAKAGLGFHPLLTTYESTADAPMLHHHSTSAAMCDHCTGAPSRPAFVRRRPPAAPPRTEDASSTASRASRTKPASSTGRASRQSSLPPSAVSLMPSQPPSPPPAPLAPSRPPLPSFAPLYAKPISDPSSKRCCADQMQPSATPTTSRSRPPCLLPPLLPPPSSFHSHHRPFPVVDTVFSPLWTPPTLSSPNAFPIATSATVASRRRRRCRQTPPPPPLSLPRQPPPQQPSGRRLGQPPPQLASRLTAAAASAAATTVTIAAAASPPTAAVTCRRRQPQSPPTAISNSHAATSSTAATFIPHCRLPLPQIRPAMAWIWAPPPVAPSGVPSRQLPRRRVNHRCHLHSLPPAIAPPDPAGHGADLGTATATLSGVPSRWAQRGGETRPRRHRPCERTALPAPAQAAAR